MLFKSLVRALGRGLYVITEKSCELGFRISNTLRFYRATPDELLAEIQRSLLATLGVVSGVEVLTPREFEQKYEPRRAIALAPLIPPEKLN